MQPFLHNTPFVYFTVNLGNASKVKINEKCEKRSLSFLKLKTHQLAQMVERQDCGETCRYCWQRRLASRRARLQSSAWPRRLFPGKAQSSVSSIYNSSASFSPLHNLRNRTATFYWSFCLLEKFLRRISRDFFRMVWLVVRPMWDF